MLMFNHRVLTLSDCVFQSHKVNRFLREALFESIALKKAFKDAVIFEDDLETEFGKLNRKLIQTFEKFWGQYYPVN